MAKIITNTVRVNRSAGYIQFDVAAGNGERITFPVSFKNDFVKVVISSYYDGADFISSGTTAQSVTDKDGFTLSKLGIPGNGNSPYWDTRESPVTVFAYGDIDEEVEDDESEDVFVGEITFI